MDKIELIDLLLELAELNREFARYQVRSGAATVGEVRCLHKYDAIVSKILEMKKDE